MADAQIKQSLQQVYQIRVSLGLPEQPEHGDLTEVPPDLDQTFSAVREATAGADAERRAVRDRFLVV